MIGFFKKEKKQPRNLKEVLARIEELEGKLNKVSRQLRELKKEGLFSIQKVGIVRFNPFSEVGGDQSFSLALLDGHNNGVVITSLYTRENNRIYGKPVAGGESEYVLSKEEKSAIEKAKEIKNNDKQ